MTSVARAPARSTVIDDMRRHVGAGRASLAEIVGGFVEVASCGSRVFDADGRTFLDCGGYGVFILGHGHPRVVAAARDQLERNPIATRMLAEPCLASAARTLAQMVPDPLEYVHFVNSGAEATEAAIKIARLSGRWRLVSMTGGYHGKTVGALSVTPRAAYQDPFRPLLPGVVHVPYGDLGALERVLRDAPGEACVILEPVQAEGGVVIPPDGYLRGVELTCHRHDAFLVVDEIQTGLGRLGSMWGCEREQVVPDVLLVGKGLSGGVVPVAAAVATRAAYEPLSRDPFLHTSTFAGSPLASTAAEAALRAIDDEGIVARARSLGERMLALLQGAAEPWRRDLVADVRGRGLLIGIELTADHFAGELVLELLARGVIVNHSLNAHRVVRLTPPAVMDDGDLDWLVRAMSESLGAVARRYQPQNGGRHAGC